MKLKDICTIKSGKSISASLISKDKVGNKVPCFGGNGLRGFVDFPNQLGGNPIIGRVGAQCGNVHYSDSPFYATEHALVVTLWDNNINKKWICWLFESMNLGQYAEGAAQPVIAAKKLLQLPIEIPPIDEQQRIVEYLDSAFAKIDALKAKAKENLDNAQALFQAALNEMMTPKEGWVQQKLNDVCYKITDGTHNSPTNTPSGTYKYITAKNIKSYGLDLSNITYVSDEIHREIYSRCNPEKGDVLYIKDGATTGIAIINPLEEEFSLLSSVALLKTKEIIDSRFLCYAMNSPIFYDYVRSKMDGAAITRVTLKKIKEFVFDYPKEVSEQVQIVRKLDTLKDSNLRLQEIYETISTECDALKQALLKQIFE